MEIFHIINLTGAKVDFESTKLSDIEKRNSLVQKTPTTTFPFLETKEGNISESKAIEYYLCTKYKPELLGDTLFEKAIVNQWCEFASIELNRCNKSIIYPIFGWNDFSKESFNKDNAKIKDYLKLIEKQLSKNEFICGNKLTLADILVFRYLRYLMMFHFPTQMRKSLFPNTEKWFEKIMNSPEAVKSYGRTVLCKTPMKPFSGKIERPYLKFEKEENEEKEENVENGEIKDKKGKKGKNKGQENTKGKELVKEIVKKPYVPGLLEIERFKNVKEKTNNPLDSLPETKFDLEKFKKDFINNTNKKGAMKNFWKKYDPEGYSLWYIEYDNEPSEFITLFRTVIAKGDILYQLRYFKKYCFGVLGVYGSDGDYKISGCLMWKGKEIPDEIKEIHCYNKLKLRKLDINEKRDQQLVHDYWTKIKENEKVFKRQAIDTRYFY